METDPKPEVKTEVVSPTGQMVGLSAWFNKLPPNVQNAIAGAVAVAGIVQVFALSAPGVIPANYVALAGAISGLGAAIGILSGGVRK